MSFSANPIPSLAFSTLAIHLILISSALYLTRSTPSCFPSRTRTRLTIHPDIPLNPITDDFRRISRRTRQINVGQVNVGANRIGRTGEIHHDLSFLPGRGAIDLVKDNVGDVHLRGILRALGRVHVEITLVQHNRLVGVFDVDVAIGDVVDAPVAHILAGPGLETSAILRQSQHWGPAHSQRVHTWPFNKVTFSMYACSMISCTPGYWPILPMLTPCVLLHHRFCTKMFVVFGFGEKQSSPISTRVLVTRSPSTLRESNPSVFLGKAFV